jgi:hypothetical protein
MCSNLQSSVAPWLKFCLMMGAFRQTSLQIFVVSLRRLLAIVMKGHEMPRKPVFEIRRRLIVARVWQRKRGGKVYHVVTISRSFVNGSEWKQSTRFATVDLPVVRYVLDRAHTWILLRGYFESS